MLDARSVGAGPLVAPRDRRSARAVRGDAHGRQVTGERADGNAVRRPAADAARIDSLRVDVYLGGGVVAVIGPGEDGAPRAVGDPEKIHGGVRRSREHDGALPPAAVPVCVDTLHVEVDVLVAGAGPVVYPGDDRAPRAVGDDERKLLAALDRAYRHAAG